MNGLHNWLMQRITAVILGLYILYIFMYIVFSNNIDYAAWYQLHTYISMKIITTLMLFSLIYHSWLGIWTVTTDYIQIPILRLIIQVIVKIILFSCLTHSLYTVWRVT